MASRLSSYLKNIFFILILLQIAPPILRNLKKQYLESLEPKTEVALLNISGIIYDSTYYVHQLKKFFKNHAIKAILLKIESPGTAAGSAEAIAHEIELLKCEFPKPIVTLTENICTSGAYYIACTTDYLIAPPSALIGSVGTKIPYQFKLKDFLEQFKIHYVSIKAGAYKDATDPFVDSTPEQIAQLQDVAQDSYQNFIEHVAKHRTHININDASRWAEGKVFTARQAYQLGLIDEIGSLSNAIKEIKKLAIIEGEIAWIKPPQERNWLSMLTGGSGDEENSGAMESVTRNLYAALKNMGSFLLK